MKYVCTVCGWEYDESAGFPEGGIAPGTPWSEVPEDFECPQALHDSVQWMRLKGLDDV